MLAGSGEDGDAGCQVGVEETISEKAEDGDPREEEGANGRGFELDMGGVQVIREGETTAERKRDGVLTMREIGRTEVRKRDMEKLPSYAAAMVGWWEILVMVDAAKETRRRR